MAFVQSFDPVAGVGATRLILGSIPGRASLDAGEYYAHPRNVFWRIIDRLFSIPTSLPYSDRCARLVAQRVALWDVLRACTRRASLDSDIVASSMVTNDLASFLNAHRDIRAVYFNGTKAERVYHQFITPALAGRSPEIPAYRLPSTSPANASISFEEKLKRWSALVR